VSILTTVKFHSTMFGTDFPYQITLASSDFKHETQYREMDRQDLPIMN